MTPECDDLARLVRSFEVATETARSFTDDERSALERAWKESRDATAMLRFLALRYPEHREAEVTAVAESLARCAPPWSRLHKMARLLVRDVGREAIDGVDRYRFIHLASHLAQELRAVENGPNVGASYGVTASDLGAAYATAIRQRVPDPYQLR